MLSADIIDSVNQKRKNWIVLVQFGKARAILMLVSFAARINPKKTHFRMKNFENFLHRIGMIIGSI